MTTEEFVKIAMLAKYYMMKKQRTYSRFVKLYKAGRKPNWRAKTLLLRTERMQDNYTDMLYKPENHD